jgi:SAM-dependent methyltransferase
MTPGKAASMTHPPVSLATHLADAGGTLQAFTPKVRDYVLSRPDYPHALFDFLRQAGACSPGASVADLGAGTGLLTRSLLRFDCKVTAVEPNDAMRVACDSALSSYADYRSVPGTAERTGLADHSVDLITAAQAFHWFDVKPARAECLRILRPVGQIALIWNDRVLSDPLNLALDPILSSFGSAFRPMVSQQEEQKQVPDFFGDGSFQQQVFEHRHQLTRDGLEALVFSRSYMPSRNTEEGRQVVLRVSRLFDSFERANEVTMRYRTLLILGRPRQALTESAQARRAKT